MLKKLAKTSIPFARWGLLVTTITIGAALVINGLNGYICARSSYDGIIRARATDITVVASHAITIAGGPTLVDLEEVIADTDSLGVRYLALRSEDGEIIAEAGEPSTLIALKTILPHQSLWLQQIEDTGRIRVASKIRQSTCLQENGSCGRRRTCLEPQRKSTICCLIIEFQPLVAMTMLSEATRSFVISIISAALAIIVALFFWRSSRKAESYAAQLERDRRLAALGEMSAVLSHELRNPLTGLKGHAQLLLEKLPDTHPGRKRAETVVHEAIRLEQLSRKILDFVKTESYQRQMTDPQTVLRAATRRFAPNQVTLSIEQPAPQIELDSIRFEQVIVNLLENAVEASVNASPVELTATVEENQWVVRVRDHGEGVTPETIAHVFEPFYTRKVQGTGLGLTIAKRIVAGHDGQIEVSNHPQGGAQFTIRIPLSAEGS